MKSFSGHAYMPVSISLLGIPMNQVKENNRRLPCDEMLLRLLELVLSAVIDAVVAVTHEENCTVCCQQTS